MQPRPPSSRPWTGSPYRRRRILWTLALCTLASVYYLTQYGPPSFSLPEYLKDMGFSSSSSPAGRIAQAKAAMYAGEGDYAYVNEVDALVYFLTAYPERKFDEDGQSLHVEDMGSVVVDAGKPVDLRVYAPDGKRDWKEYNKKVETQYPLVVFSKTYCPYSKRAKALLESYEISPAPKIIELDLRSDGPIVQAILARLTGRKTVPNILVKGKSIGGSDDIAAMHSEHRLKQVLESGGLTVKADVNGGS